MVKSNIFKKEKSIAFEIEKQVDIFQLILKISQHHPFNNQYSNYGLYPKSKVINTKSSIWEQDKSLPLMNPNFR